MSLAMFRVAALFASLAVSTVAVSNPSSYAQPYVRGAFMVEFEGSDSATFSANCDAFYKNLTSCSIAAQPRLDLNHELFQGASFKIGDEHDSDSTLSLIQSFSSVKKVWRIQKVSRPAPALLSVGGYAPPTAQLPHQRRGMQDSYPLHVMGGVDKLRANGFTGKGIFIGVVDSGIDFMHPALGKGFGPGFKVIAGESLVTDAYKTTPAAVPNGDLTDCTGHGTHVAGIVGANSNPYGFTGVAPEASLGIWKVFGCEDSTSDDLMIRGLNRAYEAGVDIISMSIGGASGWSESPTSAVVQRISEKGVVVVVAAGNNASIGLFDGNAPSSSFGAISVASMDGLLYPSVLHNATYTIDGTNSTGFGYTRGPEQNITFERATFPVYALDYNKTAIDTACKPLPDSTPDLGAYLVLLRVSQLHGVCAPAQQAENLAAKGAKRALFFNPDVGYIIANSSEVAVGLVLDSFAGKLIDGLRAGKAVNITFTDGSYLNNSGMANITPMSYFSSWGPTNELWMKPEIAAPGAPVLSTWPLAKGGYAEMHGTSMATPYVAGVVALLMEARGKKFATPSEIKTLLTTTANPQNRRFYNSTHLAPVMQQGGGGINAYKAAYTTTTVDVGYIALNDTAHFASMHVINIKNKFKQAQTYTFGHLKGPTVYTFSNGSIIPDGPALQFDETSQASASIRFDPETLTVEAGSIGKLTMYFSPPTGLDASRLPLYNGYVAINGTWGDSLTVPYMGASANMIDQKIIDTQEGYPYLARSTDTNVRLNGSDLFPLPINYKLRTDNTSYPTIMFNLALGSRVMSVDIASKAKNATNIGLRNSTTDDNGDRILGPMPDMPFTEMSRDYVFNITWNGTLADGQTPVPAGTYKLIMKALKIFGNQDDDADYEKWVSPYFNLKYY